MIGKIALVGAGPGDPELLTLKALRKIREADVVVYDRLINPALLNECRPDCQKIDVGKQPKHHPVSQTEIEHRLVTEALAGKKVVRLKSGDPYVFGRGGEEGVTLAQHKIPFEVVPGITSAIGGLAYGGIPITHRDYASSFHVIAGYLKTPEKTLDWQSLAKLEGTLVFLMGMSELKEITENLLAHGKAKTTPVAIIEWASRKQQKSVVANLENIYAVAAAAQMAPPSLIVVGDVVKLKDQLNFYEELPLFGKSIGLPKSEKPEFYYQLLDLGAEVKEFPAIQTIRLGHFPVTANPQQIIFLEPTSVEILAETLLQQGKDWRFYGSCQMVTVGRKTRERLKQYGILADESYASLADFVKGNQLKTATSLLLAGSFWLAEAKKQLAEAATANLEFWCTHKETLPPIAPAFWQNLEVLCFFNSKTARLFLAQLTDSQRKELAKKTIVVLGKVTEQVFNAVGIKVRVTQEAQYQSLVETILRSERK